MADGYFFWVGLRAINFIRNNFLTSTCNSNYSVRVCFVVGIILSIKKCQKHLWRKFVFGKVVCWLPTTFSKISLLQRCFWRLPMAYLAKHIKNWFSTKDIINKKLRIPPIPFELLDISSLKYLKHLIANGVISGHFFSSQSLAAAGLLYWLYKKCVKN